MQSTAAPKSYLPAAEREAILRRSGINFVYVAESQEAHRAGDGETSRAWLRFAKLSPKTLMSIYHRSSGQFIRNMRPRSDPLESHLESRPDSTAVGRMKSPTGRENSYSISKKAMAGIGDSPLTS